MKRSSRSKASQTNKAKAGSLSHLLSTNVAPTQSDIVSVQEGIASIQAKILELRSQIQGLEGQLHQHQAVLSPIRRVPEDVLYEILYFVQNHTLDEAKLVCRAWHAASVARRSSTGLSDLTVFFKRQDGIPTHRIRSWLDTVRQGKKALDVGQLRSRYTVCPCYESPAECPWANPDFVKLFRHTPFPDDLRVAFRASSPDCYLGFLGAIKQEYTALDSTPSGWNTLLSLRLDFRNCPWRGAIGKYRTIFNDLPQTLKSLTLVLGELDDGQVSPVIDISTECTSFSSLTTLALECPWDSPFVLSLVLQCVNLEKLSIELDSESDTAYTWAEPVAQVVLPAVHTLSLKTRSHNRLGRVLSFLTLPSLRHLTIDGKAAWREGCSQDDVLWKIMYSLRVLPDCACGRVSPLRSLTVRGTSSDTDLLHEMLHGLQDLTELVLDGVSFDAEDLLWLLQNQDKADAQPLLPHLSRLSLRSVQASEVDIQQFLQYVKARHIHNSKYLAAAADTPDKVRHVVVHFMYYEDEERDGWEGCVKLVEELNVGYGIFVERVISINET